MQSPAFTRSFLILLVVVCTNTLATTPTLAAAQPAPSYAFTVNTTRDTHDAHPGDGKCADKMGRCSLRAATEEADALPSGSRITITVPQGTYKLTLGTLKLTGIRSISITGASSKTTLIKGNHTFRIMRIAANVSAHLSQLTISEGKADYGGGIDNNGTLTVSDSTFSGNSAKANYGFGGGIENGGMLSVSNSTFSNNSADYGGGIDNNGTLTVSDSTFSGNKAIDAGGGIYNSHIGILSVSNSTFSGNKAPYGGGIENFQGMLTVMSSTLSNNSADYGGGIENEGTVTFTGTIVANSPTGGNCSGKIKEGVGYNLDSGTSCGFSRHTDLTKTNPMLGPLQDNGGPTQTMALLQGSKAIDWVNQLKDCPATDQRGSQRPDDGEHACDIGAYESAY